MVLPIQSSTPVSSIPLQPANVNPLYQDHFGISTLTQAVTPRKTFIVLAQVCRFPRELMQILHYIFN